MPDKAIGRHHDVLQSSPVKQFAVSRDIPVLQPERLRDEDFLQQLKALNADLQIVAPPTNASLREKDLPHEGVGAQPPLPIYRHKHPKSVLIHFDFQRLAYRLAN